MALPASASEQERVEGRADAITLNIPGQPLAKALAAFGAATGFEVIVDGRQTQNLVSSPVAGNMSPDEALRVLLEGTGLTVRDYTPGNVRLVAAPALTGDTEFSPARSPHASYFLFCGNTANGSANDLRHRRRPAGCSAARDHAMDHNFGRGCSRQAA
ncbi:STN domain-containing protein [Bradyrhizobium sp. ARR65]|uniref:STN domain-containing protein n=1 Tax=Bradyrhizobium sp. ARR65 TaxID=1040989 RepID=UPI0012FA48BA|nr:STN domain-containing protein [Bradyrhizobium sp. ARR65]